MELSAFDDHCVRVTLKTGEVFEGVCQYNSAEYNEIEFGKCEEGLDVANWLFCKSEIQAVERIEDEDAFLHSFGAIEEETIRDGLSFAEDVLFSDDVRIAIRLLNCIEQRLPSMPDRALWIALLKKLIGDTRDDAVRNAAQRIVEASDLSC